MSSSLRNCEMNRGRKRVDINPTSIYNTSNGMDIEYVTFVPFASFLVIQIDIFSLFRITSK